MLESIGVDSLIIVGLNHMTAPVVCREKVAVAKEKLPAVLREVMAVAGLSEAALLSTCSRLEIVAASKQPYESAARLGEWLRARGGPEIFGGVYEKTGREALTHLFRVTAGLDSWIIGESEIQGQVRRSYQFALESRCTGRVLNRAFQSALAAGKSVRGSTGIQTGISSIGGAAALLAHRLRNGARGGRVVVFGSGEAAEAVARHLAAKDFAEICVANRTLEKARAVAEPLGGVAMSFEDGLAMLGSVQAAVFSIGSESALITPQLLAPYLKERVEPLLVLDLGLPRNVEQGCAELPGVHLRNLDDLKELVRESMEKKAAEKNKAELLIKSSVSDCIVELGKSFSSTASLQKTNGRVGQETMI